MKPRWTFEDTLYVLITALALGLRLWQLGAAPLTEAEARWALQALQLATGQAVTLGGQPLYLVLTALLFGVVESTDFFARLFPAVAGGLLPLLPLFFRRVRGFNPLAGLLFALGMALDPGLVILSRQAGGPMLALALGAFALAAAFDRRWLLAGGLGGLALLGGPAVVQGACGILLAWLILKLLEKADWLASLQDDSAAEVVSDSENGLRRVALPTLGITFLVAATALMRFPQGLAAFAASLPAWPQAWLQAPVVPMARVAVSVLVYQPLGVIFALLAVGRCWLPHKFDIEAELDPLNESRPWAQRLAVWGFAAFGLALLPAGRQVSDLAWVLLPVWALAALELSRYIQISPADRSARWVAVLQAGFLFVMFAVLRLNLLAWQRTQIDTRLFWFLMIGVLLMAAIATLMVALGWSFNLARTGLAWGVGLALWMGMLASTWGGAQLRLGQASELWTPIPGTGQARLFERTLADLSEWQTGLAEQVEVVVVVPSEMPSLAWALRGYANVRYLSQLPMGEQPSVVITMQEQNQLDLAASYRGQDFTWWETPVWLDALPEDWLSWLAFRQGPVGKINLIVWARADLFPEAAASPAFDDASTYPDDQPQK